MKKYKYISLIFIFTMVMSHPLWSTGNTPVGSSGGEFQKVGSAGSQFLKIGIGARAIGMGAYGSVCNDLSSIFWNPAGLAEVKGWTAEFDYTQWIAGFNHSFAVGNLVEERGKPRENQ